MGHIAIAHGADLLGGEAGNRNCVASEGDELHFESLSARMDMDNRTDVTGLEAVGGNIGQEDDAVEFLEHGEESHAEAARAHW